MGQRKEGNHKAGAVCNTKTLKIIHFKALSSHVGIRYRVVKTSVAQKNIMYPLVPGSIQEKGAFMAPSLEKSTTAFCPW
ncbi:hypothetical protein [Desulfocicer niacini]